MKQLTMNDIYNLCNMLQSRGYDLSKLRVYLGNDDELNGIHSAWFCELVKNDNTEDSNAIIDMINEDFHNNVVNKKENIILIS